MKMYVRGYAPEKPEKEIGTGESVLKPVVTLVEYSREPEWQMQERELADYECRLLNGIHVRVREHLCAFTVEELPDAQFAVVCLAHPEPIEAPSTSLI